MNRRWFLKTFAAALAGAVATQLLPSVPTPIFAELIEAGPVGDFVGHYQWQGELLCSYPGQSFIITNIED